MTWHEYFLNIAKAVALKSKDESTKLGAVIVGPDHEIRTTGYNNMPRGIDESDPQRWTRPMKYKRIVHAEQNAIYNAARIGVSLKGCTLYVGGTPCTECSKAIIQAGIKTIFVPVAHLFIDRADWKEDMAFAKGLLSEAGVILTFV